MQFAGLYLLFFCCIAFIGREPDCPTSCGYRWGGGFEPLAPHNLYVLISRWATRTFSDRKRKDNASSSPSMRQIHNNWRKTVQVRLFPDLVPGIHPVRTTWYFTFLSKIFKIFSVRYSWYKFLLSSVSEHSSKKFRPNWTVGILLSQITFATICTYFR